MGSADTSGNVEFFFGDAVPQSFAGGKHLLVTGQSCHICHAAVQIHRADCMSHCFRLLSHGIVCLMIGISDFLGIRLLVWSAFVKIAFLFLDIKIVGLRTSFIQEKPA